MPVIEIGTFTLDSTGNHTAFLNEITGTPYKLTFKVSERYNGDVGRTRLSWGTGNANLDQEYSSNISDDSEGSDTDRGTDKVISHFGVVSGNIVKVLEASLTNVDDGEFTLNCTTATVNYQVTVIAEADS